jgi:hypothetical protein
MGALWGGGVCRSTPPFDMYVFGVSPTRSFRKSYLDIGVSDVRCRSIWAVPFARVPLQRT